MAIAVAGNHANHHRTRRHSRQHWAIPTAIPIDSPFIDSAKKRASTSESTVRVATGPVQVRAIDAQQPTAQAAAVTGIHAGESRRPDLSASH
jgi:hypothetical protein